MNSYRPLTRYELAPLPPEWFIPQWLTHRLLFCASLIGWRFADVVQLFQMLAQDVGSESIVEHSPVISARCRSELRKGSETKTMAFSGAFSDDFHCADNCDSTDLWPGYVEETTRGACLVDTDNSPFDDEFEGTFDIDDFGDGCFRATNDDAPMPAVQMTNEPWRASSLPLDPLFQTEQTSLVLGLGTPMELLGQGLLDFFRCSVDAQVSKVRPVKAAVKATVFVEAVRCSVKARVYERVQQGDLLLELQRRSGDCCAFLAIFQQAVAFFEGRFSAMPAPGSAALGPQLPCPRPPAPPQSPRLAIEALAAHGPGAGARRGDRDRGGRRPQRDPRCELGAAGAGPAREGSRGAAAAPEPRCGVSAGEAALQAGQTAADGLGPARHLVAGGGAM